MSNNKEYRKLIDDDYQEAVAEAMADAISNFLKAAGSSNAGITGTQSVGTEATPNQGAGSSNEESSETEGLSFTEESVTLLLDDIYQIDFTLPDGYEEDDLIWKSSDEDVVLVDDYGEVTAVGTGTATVAAKLEDEIVTMEVKVVEELGSGEVDKPTTSGEGLEIDAPSKIEVGETIRLTAYLDGEECDDVEWFMYDYSKQFASLSASGRLTGNKAGSITVFVELPDGTQQSQQIEVVD